MISLRSIIARAKSITVFKTASIYLTGISILFSLVHSQAQSFDTETPTGWAIVPGNGLISTTGGGDGEIVTATTAGQLAEYAGSSDPLVIQVEGTLSGIDRIDVSSNKTIIGSGSEATLNGIQLNLSGVSNVIIRNLTISGSVDAIATRRSHHVWIDHCDVSRCGDGLIDITNQSDYHTVSWTRFSDHNKTMLINSGTSKPEDMGTLNTTLHHNWWDGSDTRNPRAGYGKVHVLNCYYQGNDYGIGLHSQCKVLAERNYFFRTSNPIQQMYRNDPLNIHHGFCESVGNVFEYASGARDIEGISFIVDDYYLYDFIVDDVDSVPGLVTRLAGTGEEFSELGLLPVPGNGAVGLDTALTLHWTKGQNATDYIVHFGESFPLTILDTISEQSISIDSLDSGKVYYWRVDQILPGSTIEGKYWQFRTSGLVEGRPTVHVTSPIDGTSFANGTDIVIEAEASDSDNTIENVVFYNGFTYLGTDTLAPFTYEWDSVTNGTYSLIAKVKDNNGKRYESEPVSIVVGHGITGLPEGYELCSSEGETCTVSGLANIVYGYEGRYKYKTYVTSDQECTSENFGDPIEGQVKACYKQEITHPYITLTGPKKFSTFTTPTDVEFTTETIDGNGTVDSVIFYCNDTLLGVAYEQPFSFVWENVEVGKHTVIAIAIDNDGESFVSNDTRIYVNEGSINSLKENENTGISLYPNPIKDKLRLKLSNYFSGTTLITITNAQGATISKETIDSKDYSIDLTNVPAGVYYIIVQNEQLNTTKILIKE